MGPSNDSNSACTRKELVNKIRKVLEQMDNSNVEPRCCCTDPERPGVGKKVVATACLDGQPALQRVVPVNKDRYIWVPPVVDTRPALDPTMSCYAATVANQFYEQKEGCRLECVGGGGASGSAPHSHWWNAPKGAAPGARRPPRDYCEDPSFVAPEPVGHMAWTNEPGGACRYPQYCKAHCFDHSPERDWARN